MDLMLRCLLPIWFGSGLGRMLCTSNGHCIDLTARSVNQERQQLDASAVIHPYAMQDAHEEC